jgi:endoglycosylceramidase
MNRITIALVLTIILSYSCLNKGKQDYTPVNDLDGGKISVGGGIFTDASGRQVIFNGINYVNKDQKSNYIFNDSCKPFNQFRNWGFNCIRLGIIWDGVEPQAGKYDESYLDKVEQQVKKAQELGLYVFLDMHQDLFSVLYSDGAPIWATLNENQPHVTGVIWSDSYFMSPAVQTAFDNFWANKPATDGIGVQDHYASMWQHIAKRFAGYSNVIGYDIMNEPFNGTPGTMILPVILREYAKLYAQETGKIYTEEELLKTWSDEDLRLKALSWMSDTTRYAQVIKAATELSQKFEKNELGSMYQRVADKIREVDSTHILLLEHAYFSNAGVESGIEPVAKNGKADSLVAYAAHGYDLLVDTKSYDQSSDSRVAFIFSQINNASRRMNVPVIVGEWGALPGNSEDAVKRGQTLKSIFDKYQFSQTYWAYHEGVDKGLFFHNTFDRPNPRFISGALKNSGFNYQTGEFTCTWEESPEIMKSTVIFVPELKDLVRENITIKPENRNVIIQSMENGDGGFIIVPTNGLKSERTISFILRPDSTSISISNN